MLLLFFKYHAKASGNVGKGGIIGCEWGRGGDRFASWWKRFLTVESCKLVSAS